MAEQQRPLIEFVNLVFSGGQVGVLLPIAGKGWNESITSRSRPREHQSEGACEFDPHPHDAGLLRRFCRGYLGLFWGCFREFARDLPNLRYRTGWRCIYRILMLCGRSPRPLLMISRTSTRLVQGFCRSFSGSEPLDQVRPGGNVAGRP
jgi:hypothetical protein